MSIFIFLCVLSLCALALALWRKFARKSFDAFFERHASKFPFVLIGILAALRVAWAITERSRREVREYLIRRSAVEGAIDEMRKELLDSAGQLTAKAEANSEKAEQLAKKEAELRFEILSASNTEIVERFNKWQASKKQSVQQSSSEGFK